MSWSAFRRVNALRRLSRHERWRAHLGCPEQRAGEIYCRCAQCERDRRTYHANAHGSCVSREVDEVLGLTEMPRHTAQHEWQVSGWRDLQGRTGSVPLTYTCKHCGREVLASELDDGP